MTDRNDIEPNRTGWRRLSYTRRCGWVDWGHALPGSAQSLKKQIDSERSDFDLLNHVDIRLNEAPAFVFGYGQSMKGAGISISSASHWVVRRGLTPQQKESAALGIFMSASRKFETMQASFPFSLATNSGFSAEDLVSNLIGFYRAYRGIPEITMRDICGETSVEESLRIWDTQLPNGIGAIKNRSFKPILFSTQEGTSSPADTSFPLMLSTIAPSEAGRDWVGVQNRFIDGSLIGRRAPVNVDRAGKVGLLQYEQSRLIGGRR